MPSVAKPGPFQSVPGREQNRGRTNAPRTASSVNFTSRAAFRSGPHPPVRHSAQPLPHAEPPTVPRSARCSPNSCANRFPRSCPYQYSRLLNLSDLQARAVDQDRSHPPATVSGHVMTNSDRGWSRLSSQFQRINPATGTDALD